MRNNQPLASRQLTLMLTSIALIGAIAAFSTALARDPGSALIKNSATPAMNLNARYDHRVEPPDQDKEQDEADENGEAGHEKTITLNDAPAAVRMAALKVTSADNITAVTREEDEHDIITYEVEYTANGHACSATFASTGHVMSMEKPTDPMTMSPAAISALKHHFPNATMKDYTAVQEFTYEVTVIIDGKPHEIAIDPSGKIKGHHEWAEKGEKDEGHHDGNKDEDDDNDGN